MWTWLASFLSGPLLSKAVEAYKAKLDRENTKDHLAVEVAKAEIAAESARRAAQRDLGIAGMAHPVWWIAWGLFVIPFGLYNATIVILSTLSIGPDVYVVLRIPAAQESIMRSVVESIFLVQAGSGVAGAVIKRLGK